MPFQAQHALRPHDGIVQHPGGQVQPVGPHAQIVSLVHHYRRAAGAVQVTASQFVLENKDL